MQQETDLLQKIEAAKLVSIYRLNKIQVNYAKIVISIYFSFRRNVKFTSYALNN